MSLPLVESLHAVENLCICVAGAASPGFSGFAGAAAQGGGFGGLGGSPGFGGPPSGGDPRFTQIRK